MANVTDNEERYLRQILLLGKGGCLVLRALVNREKDIDGRSLEDILKSSKTKLQKYLLKFQFNYIFPSATDVNADIETWDISLLLGIILNVFGNVPQDEKDALNTIRKIRNKIQGHHPSYSLTEGESDELQLELIEIILKLSYDKTTKIKCLKICSYSGAGQLTKGIVLKELNAVHAFEEYQLSDLKERFGESKSKLECIGEAVNDVKSYTRTMEINQQKRQENLNTQLQLHVIDAGWQSSSREIADQQQEVLNRIEKMLTELVSHHEGQQLQYGVEEIEIEEESGVKHIKKSSDNGAGKFEVESASRVKQIEKSSDEGVDKLEFGVESGLKQKEESTDKPDDEMEIEADSGVKHIEKSSDKGADKFEVESTSIVKPTEKYPDKWVDKLEIVVESRVKQIEQSTDIGIDKLEFEVESGLKQKEEFIDKGDDEMEIKAESNVEPIEESTNKWVDKLEFEAESKIDQMSAKANESLIQIKKSKPANMEDAFIMLKEGDDEAEQKKLCLNMADIKKLWSAGRENQFLKECERICTFIKDKSDKILYVWPAYDTYEDTTLIFVCMATENVEVDVEYRLYIRIVGHYSEEEKRVMQSRKNAENRLSAEQSEKISNVIDHYANTLMQKHRHISIITGSGVRSIGFATEYEEIIPEACVVIYVLIKGKIPLDEKEIPKNLEGIPVDIREGDFQTCVLNASDYHTNVRMGCQIMSNKYGTLGGFVEHQEYGLCGITCAHVVLNDEEMHSIREPGNVSYQGNIYQPDSTLDNHFVGPVKDVIYTSGGGGVPGIDLAVFQIEKRPPECGNFPGISNSETDLVYESGKCGGEKQFNTYNQQVVKFGSKSGVTEGLVEFSGTGVRTFEFSREYKVGSDRYTYTLFNQLEIKSSCFGRPFTEVGDSGGLVFKKDVTGNLICIGMIVGVMSNGNGIVTPISAIKRHLGVSGLKKFTSNKINRLDGRMQSMERDLQNINIYMKKICDKLGIK